MGTMEIVDHEQTLLDRVHAMAWSEAEWIQRELNREPDGRLSMTVSDSFGNIFKRIFEDEERFGDIEAMTRRILKNCHYNVAQ
jgi:hypothetical protein